MTIIGTLWTSKRLLYHTLSCKNLAHFVPTLHDAASTTIEPLCLAKSHFSDAIQMISLMIGVVKAASRYKFRPLDKKCSEWKKTLWGLSLWKTGYWSYRT